MTGLGVLSYDAFVARVEQLLELDLEIPVNPYAGLYEELGLDSLQCFELIVVTEALAEAVPAEDIPDMETMQDAYDYYKTLIARRD